MNLRKKVKNAGIMIVFCLMLGVVAQGQDWTQWRGPHGNGVTDEADWNPEKLNADPNHVVLWRSKIGQGHGALCVDGERVYGFGNVTIQSRNAEKQASKDVVWCLNADTGKRLWRRAYSSEAGDFPGPRSTPVLDEDRLYTLGRHGELYCLNADTGKVIWRKQLENDLHVKSPSGGFSSSAIIYDDLLLLTAGESGIALNKLTGDVVWASDIEKTGSQATPVLFKQGDKMLAAIMSEDRLFAVDVKTGKVQWDYDWASSMDPVFLEDGVYLSNNGKGASLVSIQSGAPEEIWKKDDVKGDFSGYVLKDNFVYGCGQGGKLHCVDLKDGAVKWEHEIGAILGSLCLAQDKLIVITEDGKLFIVQASPDSYHEIATYRVFKWSPAEEDKQMGERWSCWTIPVLANGCIYVRNTDGDVACLDVRK